MGEGKEKRMITYCLTENFVHSSDMREYAGSECERLKYLYVSTTTWEITELCTNSAGMQIRNKGMRDKIIRYNIIIYILSKRRTLNAPKNLNICPMKCKNILSYIKNIKYQYLPT